MRRRASALIKLTTARGELGQSPTRRASGLSSKWKDAGCNWRAANKHSIHGTTIADVSRVLRPFPATTSGIGVLSANLVEADRNTSLSRGHD
jgi:hypothetical protein